MSAQNKHLGQDNRPPHMRLNAVKFPSSFYEHDAFILAHLSGCLSPLEASDLAQQDKFQMDGESYFPSAYKDYMTRHVQQRRHVHANTHDQPHLIGQDDEERDLYSCIDEDRPYLQLSSDNDPCLFPLTAQTYLSGASMNPTSCGLPDYVNRLPVNTWLPLECLQALSVWTGWKSRQDGAEKCLELLIRRHEDENKYYSGEEPAVLDTRQSLFKEARVQRQDVDLLAYFDSNSNSAAKTLVTPLEAMRQFAEDDVDDEDDTSSEAEERSANAVFVQHGLQREGGVQEEEQRKKPQFYFFLCFCVMYMAGMAYLVNTIYESSTTVHNEHVTTITQLLSAAATKSLRSQHAERLIALAVSSSPLLVIFFALCSVTIAWAAYRLGCAVMDRGALDKLVISTLINARFWEKGRTASDQRRASVCALMLQLVIFAVGCYGEWTLVMELGTAAQYYTLQNTQASNPMSGIQAYIQVGQTVVDAQSALQNSAHVNLAPSSHPMSFCFSVILAVFFVSGVVLQFITALGVVLCVMYALAIRTRVRSLARMLSYSSASPSHLQKRSVDLEISITRFSEQLSAYLATISVVTIVRAFALFFTALTLDEDSKYIGGNAHSSSFFIIFVCVHPLLLLSCLFLAIGTIARETAFVKKLLWRASLIINMVEKENKVHVVDKILNNDTSSSDKQENQIIERDLDMLLEFLDTAELTPQIYGHDVTSSMFFQLAIGAFVVYTS